MEIRACKKKYRFGGRLKELLQLELCLLSTHAERIF